MAHTTRRPSICYRRGCLPLTCCRGTVFFLTLVLIVCQIVFMDFYSLVIDGQLKRSPIFRAMITYLNSTRKHTDTLTQVFFSTRGVDYHNLTLVGNGTFFVYTVVAELSPLSHGWSSIVFNGWEKRDALKTNYKCCYGHRNGSMTSELASDKRMMWNRGALVAKQVVCNINNTAPPDGATLVLARDSCNTGITFRRPVYRPRDTTPKFAICAKIAYGNKNPRELVEWMEYHLHFGAAAVVIYPYYDLNPQAWKVLNYYADRGQLEIVPLPRVPMTGVHHRRFEVNSAIKNQDEQVPNYDAHLRLLPYKYFTIIDTDEFIALGENITNFVDLMDHLTSEKPDAGSFEMRTEVHLLDWERTNNASAIHIGQYGFHTEPTKLTVKLLHVTDRVVPGTVWIHSARVKHGFRRYVPDPKDVVLKHFRYCKPIWFHFRIKKPCVAYFRKIKGNFMDGIARILQPKILDVMLKLGLG